MIELKMEMGAEWMANLKHFLRPMLDVAFVALNPPVESNENAHYFSGRSSRFFDLLYLSGLITQEVSKSTADEIVFGSTSINHKHCEFGVVDLLEDVVQTDSCNVRPTKQHVNLLLERLRQFDPRFVCVMHHKVRDALNRHPDFKAKLHYGFCGALLLRSPSIFIVNYFPNGNNLADHKKLEIFRALRDAL